MMAKIPPTAWDYYETVVLVCKIPECGWTTDISWDEMESRPPLAYVEHWNTTHVESK